MYFSAFLALLSLVGCGLTAPSSRDVEQIANLVEGDMILQPHQKNGMIDETYKWPEGKVPFELDVSFTTSEVTDILNGFDEITATTCITFRSPNSTSVVDIDYVFVQKGEVGSGCYSEVGRIGGRQVINFEPRCIERHGTVIHEMLHAIGFYHEQSRPDRDDYVTIVWDKIEAGYENNFDKYGTDEVTTFGAPYDYGSVLHYPPVGFSIDGSPTIVPKIPGVVIGQRDKISQIDAGKVRLMYNCPSE